MQRIYSRNASAPAEILAFFDGGGRIAAKEGRR
jgi:hypothetical protein